MAQQKHHSNRFSMCMFYVVYWLHWPAVWKMYDASDYVAFSTQPCYVSVWEGEHWTSINTAKNVIVWFTLRLFIPHIQYNTKSDKIVGNIDREKEKWIYVGVWVFCILWIVALCCSMFTWVYINYIFWMNRLIVIKR